MTSVAPMLHVPDVAATERWYQSIGFELVDLAESCGEIVFGLLRFGASEVMLNPGGRASDADRREVDLYCRVDDVEAMRRQVGDRAEIVEDLHTTFYGAREFIIRDCNRFWITFGQPAG